MFNLEAENFSGENNNNSFAKIKREKKYAPE
jgi:hypothetical protein